MLLRPHRSSSSRLVRVMLIVVVAITAGIVTAQSPQPETLGEDERALIRNGDLNGLRTALRKKGLPTIQQVALLRAVEGITSVEEVTRITATKQNKPSAAVPVA